MRYELSSATPVGFRYLYMLFGDKDRAWINEDLLSCACIIARIAICALFVFSISVWVLEASYYWCAHVDTEPSKSFLIPLQHARFISAFPLFLAYAFSFFFRGRHRYGALLIAILPSLEYAGDIMAYVAVCRQWGFGAVMSSAHYLPMLFYRAPYYFTYCFWSRILLASTTALVLALFAFVQPEELSLSDKWRTWNAVRGKLLGILRHGSAWGIAAIGVLYAGQVYEFDGRTSGSLRASATGVFSEIVEFSNGKSRVVVVPMIHIGDRNFYQEILHKFDPFEGVTLLEGIGGDERVVKGLSHRGIASITGVTAQVDEQFRGCTDELFVCGGDPVRHCNGKMKYVPADLTTSQLREPTRKFLLEIAGLAESPESVVRAEILLNNAGMLVHDDLHRKREDRLFQELDAQKASNTLIVIPWGAGHSFDIRKRLEYKGYVKQKEESVRVFSTLTAIRLFYLGLRERL